MKLLTQKKNIFELRRNKSTSWVDIVLELAFVSHHICIYVFRCDSSQSVSEWVSD